MRIDRSDPADGPGDVHVARGVGSATDDLDVSGKDKGTAVDGDGPPNSSLAGPDSTLRTERTMAYRAVVDAAYRQAARKSPRVTDDTSAVTRDGAARAFDHQPATASGGDGNIGNGGGAQPPAGDTPPDPEGDDPEGVNGGLGELVRVNAKDRAADLLAERIGGEASVRFANGPANEFDALSTEYVAQAKPANFTLNQAFRNQAKATFEVALQSGRTPYFQFDGPPGPGVLNTLSRYADRYGIEPVIDLTPLGGANA